MTSDCGESKGRTKILTTEQYDSHTSHTHDTRAMATTAKEEQKRGPYQKMPMQVAVYIRYLHQDLGIRNREKLTRLGGRKSKGRLGRNVHGKVITSKLPHFKLQIGF